MKHLKTFESHNESYDLTPELIKSIKKACDELIKTYNQEDRNFDYEFTYDTLKTIHKFIPNYDFDKVEDEIQQHLEDGFEATDICDIALDFIKSNPIYFSKKLKNLNDVSGILENLTPFKEECIRDMCQKTYNEYVEQEKELDSEFVYEVRNIVRRYLPQYDWRKIEEYIIEYGTKHEDFRAAQICDVVINFIKENPMYASKKINRMSKATGVFENADSYNEIDFEKMYKEHRKLLDKFMRKMEKNPEQITSFDYVDILCELFKKHIGDDKDWDKFYNVVMEYGDELVNGGGDLFDDMFNFMVDYLEQNPLFFSKKLDDMNDKTGVFETYTIPNRVPEEEREEVELWKELHKEFREKVFLPSQTDDIEYCLSYDKLETQSDASKRNLYIRSKVIDFFKQHGFSFDWKAINTLLSWKDLNYDMETNFDVMFDYVQDSFREHRPGQIFMTKKLRNFSNDTGIFESLSSKLEEIKAYLDRNKDDLSTFFPDMFPGKVMSQKKLNELGFYMLEEKEYACEETTLPYNKIYFTQKFLHENGLNPDKTGRPKVYYFNNRFILEDGHHRFVNQLLNGNTNIDVLLCKLIG